MLILTIRLLMCFICHNKNSEGTLSPDYGFEVSNGANEWVTSRVFLQSAVCRMMAGAAPRRTQQLLDGSLRPRLNRSSIICGKERALEGGGGDGERAVALYMACKHLPAAVLAAPGERAGMLAQAAATLQKIGHRSRLPHCYHLMKSIGTMPSAP